MNSEELLTKQAEMVLAASPSQPGKHQRVWVYRECMVMIFVVRNDSQPHL